jgi:hypothetical protein
LWIERALLARKQLYNLDVRMRPEARWTTDDIKAYEVYDTSLHKALSSLAQLQKPGLGQHSKVLSLLDLVGQHKARG